MRRRALSALTIVWMLKLKRGFVLILYVDVNSYDSCEG